MNPPAALQRLVPWAHRLLSEILAPGDLAVDLTAGNGWDTLFLSRCVGETGRVLAFDIQEKALAAAAIRLRAAGVPVIDSCLNAPEDQPGVRLILDDHARLGCYCREAPKGIVANLGFLPGSDRRIQTETGSTLFALHASLELLAPGGRVAVVTYVGHEGALEETARVEEVFASLSPPGWHTLRLEVPNRSACPVLLVAEKRRN